MRQILKAGFFGLGAWVVYQLIAKARAIGGLVFKISRMGYSMTGNGIILTLFVSVENSKDQEILLNDLAGRFFVNDTRAGSFTLQPYVKIPASGTTVIPVSVLIEFGAVTDLLLPVIEGKQRQGLTVRIEGEAKIEDVNFPFNLSYSMI